MTPEERQMLTDFANKIAQTPAPPRDPDAEDFIRTHIGSRPDALYLMTQTVLIQNMALEHAKQEVDQWKQRAQSGPMPTSQPGTGPFLGGSGGWGSPQQPAQPAYNPPPPAPPSGGLGGLFGGGVPGGGGIGSFLRGAGTTAAGVAAGALAFEGIRSMFGGVEHMFGFGDQPRGSGFLGGAPGGETIVNNYYDRPAESRDIEDRRGFADSNVADNLAPDDSVQYDSTDVPADDSSSTDDSV